MIQPIFIPVIKVSAMLMLLFSAALGAFHVQPYDDRGLRDEVLSSHCAAPCFMGIRPGVTTREEAILLLQANPWVESVRMPDNQTIAWTWSGKQPAFLQTHMTYAQILIANEIVRWIDVQTSATMADFKIAMGVPDVTYYASWKSYQSINNTLYIYLEAHAIYTDFPLEVQLSALCPLDAHRMWEYPVLIELPAITRLF